LRVKRKGFCVLLVLVLAFTAVPLQAVTAQSASNPIEIMPFWSNINSIVPSMTISSGTATCTVQVLGFSGTTNISVATTLQRRNTNGTWTNVRTWNSSTANSFLTWSGTNAATAGNTYRLRIVATVTRNGTTETATVFSAERRT
jgi:hypothetical protein